LGLAGQNGSTTVRLLRSCSAPHALLTRF